MLAAAAPGAAPGAAWRLLPRASTAANLTCLPRLPSPFLQNCMDNNEQPGMKDGTAGARHSMQVIISLSGWDRVSFRASADAQRAYAKAVFDYLTSPLSSEHSL